MAAEVEHSLCTPESTVSIPGRRGLGQRFCSARFVRVSELPAAPEEEIHCPHCKKSFEGHLLSGGSRHQGYKCPHCRLFVPIERADDAGAQP